MKAIYVGKYNLVPFGIIGETNSETHMFTYCDFNKDIKYLDYGNFDKNEILFIEYSNMMMAFNQRLRKKTLLCIAEHNKLTFSKYCTIVCHDTSFSNEYIINCGNNGTWYIPDWDLHSLWVIDNQTDTEIHAIKFKEYVLGKLNELRHKYTGTTNETN